MHVNVKLEFCPSKLLKQQLSSLQEELKGKESRWACTHNRLRQQADSLRQENASLRDEVPASPLKQSPKDTHVLINVKAGRQPWDLSVFVSFKIRVLEKLRLNTLKGNLANADKVHEISPKTPENSTPTVSKGVKFAVSVVILLMTHFDHAF